MKVYFETLGCPKNFNDTEVAIGYLTDEKNSGFFEIAEGPEDADVIVVNTCGFINDAKRESIDRIFEMAEYRQSGKKLIVSGCLSERYAKELADEMPEVDHFIGVNEYGMLPEILREIAGGEDPGRSTVTGKTETVLPLLRRELPENSYTSTLKIAEGCNNRCAYCVIPDIRGNYRSKRMEDVIKEAETLAASGVKELILIAQDVTNYGRDLYGEYRLAALLRELCRIEGIQWIRLMYCYEDRITDELIDVIRTEPKICHYLDIPIQHCSDRILKAMRRRSTSMSIRTTIQKLRDAIPDIAIRTTFIVGFPGETEEDFEELLDFVEEVRFSRLGVFSYSREEGTPAGEMENQIDEDIKDERLDLIMRAQLAVSYEDNRKRIGSCISVMTDYEDEDGSYVGRTQFDAPEIDNSVLFTSKRKLTPGEIVEVMVNDAYDYDLVGYVLEDESK